MSDTVKTLVLEIGRVYYYDQYLFERGEPKAVPVAVADELLEEHTTALNGNNVVHIPLFREVKEQKEDKPRKAKTPQEQEVNPS
jgi:hypothetical protein